MGILLGAPCICSSYVGGGHGSTAFITGTVGWIRTVDWKGAALMGSGLGVGLPAVETVAGGNPDICGSGCSRSVFGSDGGRRAASRTDSYPDSSNLSLYVKGI